MRYTVLKSFMTTIHRFTEGDEVDDSEVDGVLTASQWAELGFLGDAEADDLDSLREEAEGLGIRIDRRWGERKLREVIEEEKMRLTKVQVEPPVEQPEV